MTSHPTGDIIMDVRRLLTTYSSHKRLASTMISLIDIMASDDRDEFVRLMQKWLASS